MSAGRYAPATLARNGARLVAFTATLDSIAPGDQEGKPWTALRSSGPALATVNAVPPNTAVASLAWQTRTCGAARRAASRKRPYQARNSPADRLVASVAST